MFAAVAGALSALIAAPAFAATESVETVTPATPMTSATTAPETADVAAAAAGGESESDVSAAADPCAQPPAGSVPDLVATVFRCRLAPHLGAERAAHVAAEAVVVAECESHFDPGAVVFDGRYTRQPHPLTGMYYTATGVFQFIRTTADEFIVGGYAAATDPVANIEGAVRVYLDSLAKGGRGWESWECAAVNGSFRPASVLPGWPGGPGQLPSWAYDY